MNDIIFSNEVSEVLQGEANHSPCSVPGDVECKISSIAFWNTLGIHPYNFSFLPCSPQFIRGSEERLNL